MAKYELTREATDDLYRIWDYTVDTWSEQQADKYYSQLVSSFRMIAEKPTGSGKSYDAIYPGLKGERGGIPSPQRSGHPSTDVRRRHKS